ncbi:hypothetical protein BDA99DRAFT_499373, partial [Phascolomyces articulosus]
FLWGKSLEYYNGATLVSEENTKPFSRFPNSLNDVGSDSLLTFYYVRDSCIETTAATAGTFVDTHQQQGLASLSGNQYQTMDIFYNNQNNNEYHVSRNSNSAISTMTYYHYPSSQQQQQHQQNFLPTELSLAIPGVNQHSSPYKYPTPPPECCDDRMSSVSANNTTDFMVEADQSTITYPGSFFTNQDQTEMTYSHMNLSLLPVDQNQVYSIVQQTVSGSASPVTQGEALDETDEERVSSPRTRQKRKCFFEGCSHECSKNCDLVWRHIFQVHCEGRYEFKCYMHMNKKENDMIRSASRLDTVMEHLNECWIKYCDRKEIQLEIDENGDKIYPELDDTMFEIFEPLIFQCKFKQNGHECQYIEYGKNEFYNHLFTHAPRIDMTEQQ